jgi:hypothetical protein
LISNTALDVFCDHRVGFGWLPAKD